MEKRGAGKILTVLISAVLIIIALHLMAHFTVYGTRIPTLGEKGVSGLAIGPLGIDESEFQDIKGNTQKETFSKYLIVGEWLFLIVLVLFTFVKDRVSMTREVIDLNIKERYKNPGNKTDLDILYEILKEKKTLRVSTISKMFNIDKRLVMDWINTLESGDLASINYPRFGEPEVRIN
ncbi:hypothetical protein CO038_00995 [Candidatus Pacearchaeota archaeon CG_4_9_14_0_2_um_filter_39_13]|nr:hypothetical protein [Candidatus Pacearchaeota archaeon]OIO43104.1 MAG: hypothetical protein AUJ64_02890 [Candidatus Pacearchaeota archaeon CG1_02_39_14]PJC44952.1 MAG: hypothetical protein CO038_00995 [Candidatus Pacearchaeota archaeon CG_4_9_14_0_2_um_filter_39_13]